MSMQAKASKSAAAAAVKIQGRRTPKTFIVMVLEAIKAGEDEKRGVTRAAIKNFIGGKYAVDFKNRGKVNLLNKAIKKGIEDKVIRNGRTSESFRIGPKADAPKKRRGRKPKTSQADKPAEQAEKKPRAKAASKEPKPAKAAKPAKVAKPKTVIAKKASLKKTASKAATEQ